VQGLVNALFKPSHNGAGVLLAASSSTAAWECSLNVGFISELVDYQHETDSAQVERSNGAKNSAKRAKST
jgi:hypothetical protein